MQQSYNVYSRNIDKSLSHIKVSDCYWYMEAIVEVVDHLKQTNVYHDKLAVLTVINGGIA